MPDVEGLTGARSGVFVATGRFSQPLPIATSWLSDRSLTRPASCDLGLSPLERSPDQPAVVRWPAFHTFF
jgi:hypothetical protein